MRATKLSPWALAVPLLVPWGTASGQTPVGIAFTFQGQLSFGGSVVDDTCDLEFSLFDAEIGGTQIGTTQTVSNVEVTDGLFTVPIDFGAGAFPGEARWLEVGVRCPADPTDMGAFIVLTPRVELRPTPYSIRAGTGVGDLNALNVTLAGVSAYSQLLFPADK